jgi:GcrA cell cycle regulator
MDGRHTWNRADIERLMRLRPRHSVAELAREFGTTRGAVGGLIWRQCQGIGSSAPLRMTRRKPKYSQTTLNMREHPLLSLEEGCCHWPLGNPGEAGFRFCGDKVVPQRSYCAHHLRIGARQ